MTLTIIARIYPQSGSSALLYGIQFFEKFCLAVKHLKQKRPRLPSKAPDPGADPEAQEATRTEIAMPWAASCPALRLQPADVGTAADSQSPGVVPVSPKQLATVPARRLLQSRFRGAPTPPRVLSSTDRRARGSLRSAAVRCGRTSFWLYCCPCGLMGNRIGIDPFSPPRSHRASEPVSVPRHLPVREPQNQNPGKPAVLPMLLLQATLRHPAGPAAGRTCCFQFLSSARTNEGTERTGQLCPKFSRV